MRRVRQNNEGLGIDTSSLATSVAVIEDNKLICEYTINTKKLHSQSFLMIEYVKYKWFKYNEMI